MLRGNSVYYLILLMLFSLLVWVEYSLPKPIDWRRTYQPKDKIPFGCNALYRVMNEDFFKGKVKVLNEKISDIKGIDTMSNTAMFFVGRQFSATDLDSKYLLGFVSRGNSVFIAATSLSGLLSDTFHLETKYNYRVYVDSAVKTNFYFYNKILHSKKKYSYKNGIEFLSFSNFDTSKSTLLAADDTSTIFLKISFGKGEFYFLSVPDIYTNYFIVNNLNREFAYKTLSYINSNKIIWNEYAQTEEQKNKSLLQFIFNNDALYAAYLLALVSLMIFMVFALKRKQKVIPIAEPLQNTTLQFVEVVGNIYYNAKNHKIIAEEEINSFYEFLRNKFFIKSIDGQALQRISKLSTIPEEEIRKLFEKVDYIIKQESITEQELIELNTLIEKFYKLNKR